MIKKADRVEHAEFGIGTVISILGDVATVDFFGESIDVGLNGLLPRQSVNEKPLPTQGAQAFSDFSFRKVFEAVNLGVVPRDPDELVNLTIGGERMSEEFSALLSNAAKNGVCRIFVGYYGSGKSHHLQVAKSVALRNGWVTAFLELDPKAADPAKPSTVYQGLISGLEFPARADGARNVDFFDLVKEIRDNWARLRDLPYFKRSPWFSQGVAALLFMSHRRDDAQYVAAVNWLAGQVKQIGAIRSLTGRAGFRNQIPALPQQKDTGLIYAFQLVVLHEVLKSLGYKGLAIIIDEAEHVRSYSIARYLRANNFFDIMARCAHRPRTDLKKPNSDFEHFDLPPFWKDGPHFALFVGLTEGEDTADLEHKVGEMNALIHDPDDVVHLSPPDEAEYGTWSRAFLDQCGKRLGTRVLPLLDPAIISRIAANLHEQFGRTPADERILRNWTKMAGLAPAILMSNHRQIGPDELCELVDKAARDVAGEMLPWDE